MLRLNREHKTFQIGSVRIGGVPGQVPTVLIGSMFYNKHSIVENELTGEFNREQAQTLIKKQEELSDKTGNPCMIDVVGSTTEALSRYVDFVSGITQAPVLFDGVTASVRVGALDHIREVGLTDRVVYNSIVPDAKPDELEKIKTVGIESSILLALNTKEFTSQGRVKATRELLPIAAKAGIKKPLIDTAVVDIPSLGMACRAIQDLRTEFGLPVGSGAHNAIDTWRGLKKKMGIQARESSISAACTMTIAAGANFILYGPIESAEILFPAVAMVDAALAQVAREEKLTVDRAHPLFKIA